MGIWWDTRECFVVLVDRRDTATLLSFIHRYVLPGTTIYSDQWRAYNAISKGTEAPDRYIHLTVNLLVNFVDRTTMVHIQNIENMRIVPKIEKKIKWDSIDHN